MSELLEFLPLILILLASGLLSGLMAGLLGIGGGIVLVPILEISLGFFNVDESIRMHIAIATSLAIIIVTSFSSTRAHHKRGTVDVEIIKSWAISILVGAAVGSWAASKLNGKALVIIFAFLALFVAFKMLVKGDIKKVRDGIPNYPAASHLLPHQLSYNLWYQEC